MSEDLDRTPGGTEDSPGGPSEDLFSGVSGSLSDDLSPPDMAPGDLATPIPPIQPEPLPEEFKPYSQFPWDQVPEGARGDFLAKLKKFHGDLSRNSQDAAKHRDAAEQFRQKADWFDQLTSERWFQDAYLAQKSGAPAPSVAGQQQPLDSRSALKRLSEFGLDPETGEVIDTAINKGVEKAIAPLAEQLSMLQQQLVHNQTTSELTQLRDMAGTNGWPSPDDKLAAIGELIRSGRARNALDAYKLAVFEEVPTLSANQARLQLQDELRRKAETTIAPPSGPPGTPGDQIFVGDNAVEEAMRASMAEIAAQTARRR